MCSGNSLRHSAPGSSLKPARRACPKTRIGPHASIFPVALSRCASFYYREDDPPDPAAADFNRRAAYSVQPSVCKSFAGVMLILRNELKCNLGEMESERKRQGRTEVTFSAADNSSTTHLHLILFLDCQKVYSRLNFPLLKGDPVRDHLWRRGATRTSGASRTAGGNRFTGSCGAGGTNRTRRTRWRLCRVSRLFSFL